MGRKRLNKITQPPPDKPTARLRDGTTLTIGDEVTTDWHKSCEGQTFVIEAITPYQLCESGAMVLAHLKEDPTRKLEGFKKEGYVKTAPPGMDANHFKKI